MFPAKQDNKAAECIINYVTCTQKFEYWSSFVHALITYINYSIYLEKQCRQYPE